MKLLSFFFLFFFFILLLNTNLAISTERFPIWKTITVDKQGKGDFSSVQSAINSVQLGNKRWIKIHVKSGVYREKVVIPVGKDNILLEGEGTKTTTIVSSRYIEKTRDNEQEPPSTTLSETATFSSAAENIVVKDITFKNDHDAGNEPIKRALAAFIRGDKTSFYDCAFISLQDTLYDSIGRHYFKGCYIEGVVDFIFGSGQSIYEKCTIYANSSGWKSPGWITAQGRKSQTDSNGFVFKYCNLIGTGKTFLGRAWGPNSRVLFFMSFMTNVVVPHGWDSWNKKPEDLIFAEAGCIGPGSNTTGRVNWKKNLSRKDLQMLSSIQFIDDEGWIEKQPSDVE